MKLHNSLTGRKEAFAPADPKRPTMYVCGPTVYNHPHIGNARAAVVFDVLFRVLKHRYGDVLYARNITDIEDKIIKAAEERGVATEAIVQEFTACLSRGHGRAERAPAYDRAARHRAHSGDAEDDRRADRRRPRLRGGGPRPVSRALVCRLRPPLPPLARRDDRRRPGRGRAVQARSGRFRAVEAVDARAARLGQPLWPRPARLAHRVLGDDRGAPRRSPSTSTAAARTSSSRITRTRSRRASAPTAAGRWPACGCTTAFSTSSRRRCRSRSATSCWCAISCPMATNAQRGAKRSVTRCLSAHYRKPLDWAEAGLARSKQALDRLYLTLRDLPGPRTRLRRKRCRPACCRAGGRPEHADGVCRVVRARPCGQCQRRPGPEAEAEGQLLTGGQLAWSLAGGPERLA